MSGRPSLALIGTLALVLGAWSAVARPQPPAGKEKPAAGAKKPFAVVELFTSQGCDSCPAADKVLAELVRKARKDGSRVFGLSFHVDYWDRLGWKDPYGGASFTTRQRGYAKALRLEGIYTPQTVVNGAVQFVGSEAAVARKSVEAALKTPAAVGVGLTLPKDASGDRLDVSYVLTSAPKGAVLSLAVVERGLSNKVPRGENAGRTLAHENVVRAWKSTALKGEAKGKVEVTLPRGLVRKNASVVAFVQDPVKGTIVGAESADLPAK